MVTAGAVLYPEPPEEIEMPETVPLVPMAAVAVAEVMVIGGSDVYALALPRATRILRTRVHAQVAGDTWFPALAATDWRVTASERFMPDARNAHAMTFETLERISVA